MSKFWKATSVNATNGSAIVTVNTGDDVALIRANSLLQIGALQVVEVKTANTSNQTIELFDAWNGGSISGQSAIAAPSAAELAQAIDDVRTLTTAYEGIADDVSVNPTANSIVKRTSAGRVKTATPSAADDAVNLGYLGTAATRDVGTAAGDVLEVGGLGYGLNNNTLPLPPNNNLDTVRQAGVYRVQNDTIGRIVIGGTSDVGVVEHFVRLGDEGIGRHFQEYRSPYGDQRYFRNMLSDGSWSEWFIIYHSGNTNFNEFGGTGADRRIAEGTARGTTSAFIKLPLNSTVNATSVSVTGSFKLTDHTGTNVLVSGIPSNAFSLTNTRGSNKFFTLLVNVAGGLTGKEPVYLETESADAKIVPLF